MNRFTKLCALCAMLLMSITVFADDANINANYKSPSWNEYPISFSCIQGDWNVGRDYVYCSNVAPDEIVSLSATVEVDDDATLCFDNYEYYPYVCPFDMTVQLDGMNVLELRNLELQWQSRRFVEMPAGRHTVTWHMKNVTSSANTAYICNTIGVRKTPTISVTLLEAGSLGTEILYNVDRLQEVRKLKIAGPMNNDDWDKIEMIKSNLFMLDLSETTITNISEKRFYDLEWLHTVMLPEGLTTIGKSAFYETPVVNVNLPSTLTTIGTCAFYRTNIREAIISDNCIDIDTHAFFYCHSLKTARLSNQLKTIPESCFERCYILEGIEIPEGVTEIKGNAFNECYYIHPSLPNSLERIGGKAFYNTNSKGDVETVIVIPDKVTYIGSQAFKGTSYTDVTLPGCMNEITSYGADGCFPDCTKTIRLECPTVVNVPTHNYVVIAWLPSSVTLYVPDYLVPAYKLHSYWYNFGKIEGFSTEEVDHWIIKSDLVLGARDRMLGTPSIEIHPAGSLKINGTDGMPVNDLWVRNNIEGNKAQIFSNTDGVVINGELKLGQYASTKNRWYFIALPFNAKVNDFVAMTYGHKRAIRYYDGANRAANGTGGNWKNFSDDDIIPAGTGFIFNASEVGWWNITSQNDESKQYMTSTRMFVKQLEENPSATASNRGWNLVGNPYQCWYNIPKIRNYHPIHD